MKLSHDRHLAYCTNIHRGESWAETLGYLENHTLRVRERVCPDGPYAIGLRLSARAARELADGTALRDFQHWLDRNNCYVFTLNGFPFGDFHQSPVKEHVYEPDWSSSERLAYTILLFDLLAELVPSGLDGGVSTLPVTFKGFERDTAALKAARTHLWACLDHIEALRDRTGKELHLDLEPEPCCLLETTDEVVKFFAAMKDERAPAESPMLQRNLRVNYDVCHQSVEFESPGEVFSTLEAAGIRIGKIHLSCGLRFPRDGADDSLLDAFGEDTYLHQVVSRHSDGSLHRFSDLPNARAANDPGSEWRIHYHLPLHTPPDAGFETTAADIPRVFHELARRPGVCRHLEIETYTWEVLPPELKARDVVDQIAAEYDWCLERLERCGLR